MARRHLFSTFAFAGCSAIVGCSLFTDLGGLTGGSSGASGSPASDSGSSTDGTMGGGDGTTGDAGTDGAGDSSSPITPCVPGSTHLFCTSFDTGTLGDIFESYGTGSGGALAIESTSAYSKPSALRIGHPGGDTTSTPYAAKTIPVSNLKGVRCRMRYRRETMGGGILVLFIAELKTNGSARLFAEVKDGASIGKLYLETTKPDTNVESVFPDIPTVSSSTNDWADVDWTLDFDGSRSKLLRDGATVDERPLPAPFDGRSAKSLTITAGLGLFQAPTSPWVVRIDDVYCDAL